MKDNYYKEHKWLITAGLLCLSIVLLLLPSVMNESDNNWIKETEERCNSSCNDINMTMLMISDELQCVCTSETPGVRSYPWKG